MKPNTEYQIGLCVFNGTCDLTNFGTIKHTWKTGKLKI